MRIITVDLHKKTNAVSICCVLIVLIVIASVVISSLARGGAEGYFSGASGVPYEKIIIIDAGHGGEDSGAIGSSGVLEKDLNLEIALMLGEMLSEEGFVTVYTRTDDRLLYKDDENVKGIRKISDLKNRCAFAENYPDSLFVSIHMNSFGDPKYSGLQVYYSENGDSEALAASVQNSVRERLQNDNNRKIKAGRDIYLLEHLENPAILIECGFLTNKDEEKRLSQKDYQKQLCSSIIYGIIEYIGK